MKNKKILVTCLCVILISVAIGIQGCGKNSVESKLVGTWKLEDSTTIELVFYEDGTWRHGNGTIQVSGDYNLLSDHEIELINNGTAYDDSWHIAGIHEFTLDGNKLAFEKLGAAPGTYIKVD